MNGYGYNQMPPAVPMGYDPQMPSTSSTCFKQEPPGMTPPETRPHTPSQRVAFGVGGGMPSSPYRRTAQQSEPVQRIRQGYAQTQQWMQDQYFVPGQLPQGYPPQAASVMSGASHMSQMSHMSNQSNMSMGAMSTLTINTQIMAPTNAHHLAALHHSSASSTCSAAENIDPHFMERLDQYMDIWINNFNTKHQNAVVNEISVRARAIDFKHANKEKLRRMIYLILRELNRPDLDERMAKHLLQIMFHLTRCSNSVDQMMHLQRDTHGAMLTVICGRLVPGQSYATSAVICLKSLFTTRYGAKFRAAARTPAVMNSLIALLRPGSGLADNTKAMTIDCIRNLIIRHLAFKQYLISENSPSAPRGMDLFLEFMGSETDERVLYETARIVYSLISVEGKESAEKFVVKKGIQIFANLLSHGSSRLLQEILRVLASVTDVDAVANEELSTPIDNVLRLLGAFDPIVAQYATGFLLNVTGKNPANKRTILQARGPAAILSVLETIRSFFEYQLPDIRQIVDDIQENSLVLLANLTSSFGGADLAIAGTQQIAQKSLSSRILLNLLVNACVRDKLQTLKIIIRTIQHVPTYMHMFVDGFDGNPNLSNMLLRLIWDAFVQFPKQTEELHRAVYRNLVDFSVQLLRTLLKEEEFKKQIVEVLKDDNNTPILLLTMVADTKMQCCLLNLLDEVSSTSTDIVSHWLADLGTAQLFAHNFCAHSDADITTLSRNIYGRHQPSDGMDMGFSDLSNFDNPMADVWTANY